MASRCAQATEWSTVRLASQCDVPSDVPSDFSERLISFSLVDALRAGTGGLDHILLCTLLLTLLASSCKSVGVPGRDLDIANQRAASFL